MNFKKCKQGHSQETTTSDLFLAVCRQLCAGIELTLDPSRVKMSITHGLLFAVMSQSYVALLYPFFLIHLCIKAGITYLKLIIDRIIAKVSQRSQAGIHRQTKKSTQQSLLKNWVSYSVYS